MLDLDRTLIDCIPIREVSPFSDPDFLYVARMAAPTSASQRHAVQCSQIGGLWNVHDGTALTWDSRATVLSQVHG